MRIIALLAIAMLLGLQEASAVPGGASARSSQSVEHAQKALADFRARPGVSDLIRRKIITSVTIDYAAAPPELIVEARLPPEVTLAQVEREVPVSFDGLPILLVSGQTFEGETGEFAIFGTDPKRPGRGP